MKVAITLGYTATTEKGEPHNLYTGTDAAKAREICEDPPAGIGCTVMYVNPGKVRRRSFPGNLVVETLPAVPETDELPAVAEVAEPEAPAAEEAAPAEPESLELAAEAAAEEEAPAAEEPKKSGKKK